MLFDIDLILTKPKGSDNPFTYYPETYNQDSSKSIIGANSKYDLTRLSQHELDILNAVFSTVSAKYPVKYQALGLVNEAYVITYKPRYILFEIAVTKYKETESYFDKFAAAFAFANKGADFRLAALKTFEESINKIPFSILDEFASLNFALTCNLFSRLYEQEWEFDNSIYWLRKALYRIGLNNNYLKNKIKEIQQRKKDVEQTGKHKRSRKISVENEKFENDVHNAAIWFLQEYL